MEPQQATRDFRNGSKAEVANHDSDVRYTPKSGSRDARGGAVHSIISGHGGIIMGNQSGCPCSKKMAVT